MLHNHENSPNNLSEKPWYFDDVWADENIYEKIRTKELTPEQTNILINEIKEALKTDTNKTSDELTHELNKAVASQMLFDLQQYKKEVEKDVLDLGETTH